MKAVSALLVGLLVLAVGLALSGVARGTRGEEPDARAHPVPEAPPEATHYPGMTSIVDADRHDDTWYVLDARASRVHLLRADGTLRSVRVGSGRGEIAGRAQVLLVHADTVLVIERRGGRMYLHALDGTFLGQRQLSIPGCSNPRMLDGLSRPQGIVTLATCPGRRLNTRAFATLETGIAQPRVLLSTASRPRPEAEVDPYFTPVLVGHPEGIAFGNARDDCLAVVDMAGARADSICHRDLDRLPTPDQERAAVARARIAARALGARLAPAMRLPPFDRAWSTGSGGYLYRAPTPEGVRTRRLVTHDTQVLPGPSTPPAQRVFVARGEALFGWLSGEEVRLARYRLPG